MFVSNSITTIKILFNYKSEKLCDEQDLFAVFAVSIRTRIELIPFQIVWVYRKARSLFFGWIVWNFIFLYLKVSLYDILSSKKIRSSSLLVKKHVPWKVKPYHLAGFGVHISEVINFILKNLLCISSKFHGLNKKSKLTALWFHSPPHTKV